MTRPPGRPPLDDKDPSVSITFRLPSKQMIDLCAQAQRERRSLPDLLRHLCKLPRPGIRTLK